jgi:hypothetical protein
MRNMETKYLKIYLENFEDHQRRQNSPLVVIFWNHNLRYEKGYIDFCAEEDYNLANRTIMKQKL